MNIKNIIAFKNNRGRMSPLALSVSLVIAVGVFFLLQHFAKKDFTEDKSQISEVPYSENGWERRDIGNIAYIDFPVASNDLTAEFDLRENQDDLTKAHFVMMDKAYLENYRAKAEEHKAVAGFYASMVEYKRNDSPSLFGLSFKNEIKDSDMSAAVEELHKLIASSAHGEPVEGETKSRVRIKQIKLGDMFSLYSTLLFAYLPSEVSGIDASLKRYMLLRDYYLFFDNGKEYLLSFQYPESEGEKWRPIVRQLMESFRLITEGRE